MTWVEGRIGDFAEIRHGFAFKSDFFTDNGELVVLTPGNCFDRGGFRRKGDKEKFYQGPVPAGYLLKKGDLVVVMTDLVSTAPVLGGAFIIPEDDRFLHNQRLGLFEVTRPDVMDKRFLYHLLNTSSYRGQVRGSATGATVRHTAPVRIKECLVRYPRDIREQSRIADILCAFEYLIENNRQRIMLLEQAARLLYREWFVHFRFPGHEHDNIIDGLPEHWERRSFGDIAELRYGKALKQENRVEGRFPVYGSSGIIGTHQAAFVEGPTIIVGRKGNVGSVYWSPVDVWPIDTVYYIPKEQVDFWLYLALPAAGFQNTDAGVPGLNRDFAYSRKLVQPSERLRRLFNEAVEPMFAQRTTLETQIQKLTQARDLLLPRLMSGEIAV